MTHRHAVLDSGRRLEARELPARFLDACAAFLRRGRWGAARPPRALTSLSPSARALLRRILERDERTLRVPAVSSAAIGLELADIVSISRLAEPAAPGVAFALTVNPWALAALRRHPELLEVERAPAPIDRRHGRLDRAVASGAPGIR
jgi:hypothetical protein